MRTQTLKPRRSQNKLQFCEQRDSKKCQSINNKEGSASHDNSVFQEATHLIGDLLRRLKRSHKTVHLTPRFRGFTIQGMSCTIQNL